MLNRIVAAKANCRHTIISFCRPLFDPTYRLQRFPGVHVAGRRLQSLICALGRQANIVHVAEHPRCSSVASASSVQTTVPTTSFRASKVFGAPTDAWRLYHAQHKPANPWGAPRGNRIPSTIAHRALSNDRSYPASHRFLLIVNPRSWVNNLHAICCVVHGHVTV